MKNNDKNDITVSIPSFMYDINYMCLYCYQHTVNYGNIKCSNPNCNCNSYMSRNIGKTIIDALIKCFDYKTIEYDCKYSANSIDIDTIKKQIVFDLDLNFKNTLIDTIKKIFGSNMFHHITDFDNSIINDINYNYLINYYCDMYNYYIKGIQKISKIKVLKLFGYFSYEYNLNENDNLSIILGNNGIGKTTLFKIMESLIVLPKNDIEKKEKIRFLFQTPFKLFEIDFSDGLSIVAKKRGKQINVDIIQNTTRINHLFDRKKDGVVSHLKISSNKNFKSLDIHYNNMKLLFNRINQSNKFLFITVNRVNDLNSIKNNLLLNKNKIKSFDKNFESACFPSFVLDFDNKYQAIKKLINQYDYFYDYFDSCFNKKKYKKVCSELNIFNDTSDKKTLKNINLITYNPFEVEDIDVVRNIIKDFLDNCIKFKELFESFYIDSDSMKKNIVYSGNDIKHKIKINVKPIKSKVPLDVDKLSSGEINIASLIYNLIFNAEEGAVIFVDEPEISLHIAWQQRLSDLILNLIEDKKNTQVIVASHSPFVSSGHSDLLVCANLINKKRKK